MFTVPSISVRGVYSLPFRVEVEVLTLPEPYTSAGSVYRVVKQYLDGSDRRLPLCSYDTVEEAYKASALIRMVLEDFLEEDLVPPCEGGASVRIAPPPVYKGVPAGT
jgi:hypothetical protein